MPIYPRWVPPHGAAAAYCFLCIYPAAADFPYLPTRSLFSVVTRQAPFSDRADSWVYQEYRRHKLEPLSIADNECGSVSRTAWLVSGTTLDPSEPLARCSTKSSTVISRSKAGCTVCLA